MNEGQRHPSASPSPLNSSQRLKRQLLGIGQGVQVLLGGLDLAVPEAVHDGLEVGAAGEQPGCVGVAQVVHPDVEAEPGGFRNANACDVFRLREKRINCSRSASVNTNTAFGRPIRGIPHPTTYPTNY